MRDILDDVPTQKILAVKAGLERLTPREIQVLKQAISGETAADTAAAMGISRRTVEVHRQQILNKLGVKNLTQAVRMIALAERREPPE